MLDDRPAVRPARYLDDEDFKRYVPVHVVWEITLACDLKCLHCGSRAGHRRPNELSTAECLEVIDALAALGTREITLIGGEAYLRKDWTQLIRAIRGHGMYCAIQTGGRNLNPARLQQAIDAGLNGVGVSLDGLPPLHDKVRNVPGAFDKAVDALRRAKAAGLAVSVNTQIGAATMPDLPALMDQIIELGATHWQIQLTVAMGNAVDHDELLLQPYQLLELMPLLARLYREGVERGLLMNVGNNIGYYGPYERLWRGFGDERVHWSGCAAGQTVLALEADGTVKGCPSLATVGFSGGNVRDMSLDDIWHHSEGIHFGRLRSVDDLWGYCRSCYYNDVCRGGCTWTSHSLLGKPGNNPYCHYRALELEKQGLRERIVKLQDAAPASFAVGRFDLITEDIASGQEISRVSRSGQVIALSWKNKGKAAPREGRPPTKLALCRQCQQYIHPDETCCPHCAADIAAADRDYQLEQARRQQVIDNLRRLLGLPAD
ncbi:Y-X(10)_GDL-associated radical SAM protein [Chromobacterium alkanivorans]|uniref:GDL motif peptide-associated radical SAM/SPASM maturase n=1 Tax=Chromobacterium TaxID=535 RepID=UPI0006534B9D|nr:MULTISPECIES: GDL motif peptide-associated radical SAM/SPASM maturase [Chromobacterium]KMN81432.1 heme transporter CcmD [Chromobacterium sp. LK11]MBN3002994.1 GDL motif peptide-associated radical SAM/SPASM maturase [Chromobacterium alkanivorans]MCS3803835.1 Y-X(10)_GDL-associated radical SAM protein [Chromobacterium alkanivorans]MCS3818060.1 Y-X(10)_GDL-associated radical SAM protein [Chromobacterium alkanivorans]MCS3876294.1 Y-X(10)_GDL-associated radical SAM protein [Chromobacterium alkan